MNAKFAKLEQLSWFRGAIVIHVLPKSQRSEDGILFVDSAIAVTAVLWLVILSESEKAVP
jgi:hypothetical protein